LVRGVRLAFVSGLPGETDRQRGFEAGAVDYIGKPFAATDFIYRIISHAKTAPVLAR
jgi:DNA-binding response OmpR family regulator